MSAALDAARWRLLEAAVLHAQALREPEAYSEAARCSWARGLVLASDAWERANEEHCQLMRRSRRGPLEPARVAGGEAGKP